MNSLVKTSLQVASVGVAVIASSAFSAANAAQFNFSYTNGSGINASGVITTDTAGTLVTGITGQRNGVPITSLISINGFVGNDNVFIPSGTPAFLTQNGLSFSVQGGSNFNLFFLGGGYAESDSFTSPSVTATFTPAETVPEPSTLLGLGLLGMGALVSRKRKG